jgi:hypothetical protein
MQITDYDQTSTSCPVDYDRIPYSTLFTYVEWGSGNIRIYAVSILDRTTLE